MGWLGGLAGPRRCPRAAPGWPGGGLDRVYYPGTIQELSGNYPGTIRELSGIWLAGLGWPGWQGQMGENFGIQ